MWCVCLLAREDFDVLLWSGDYGRTKLGTLNRMLNSLLEEGIDENGRRQGVRARTLAVLVRQLETVKGVRALEAASHAHGTRAAAGFSSRGSSTRSRSTDWSAPQCDASPRAPCWASDG